MSVKIGITGHRHLLQPMDVMLEIKKAIEKILREKNVTEFGGYSSLAIGADTVFAEAVLELDGTLHAILPLGKREYKKDFNETDQKKLKDLLSECRSIKTNHTWKSSVPERRNNAYLNCGKEITDTCDVMIAVWDGKQAGGVGGTGDIVAYAKKKKKDVHIITASQNELQKLKYSRDLTAIDFQQQYEKKWLTCLLLGICGATLLATGIAFSEELPKTVIAVISAIQFVLVVLLIIYILELERGYLKSNRIINRREAERLRVIEKLYKGKLEIRRLENNNFITPDVSKLEEKYIAERLETDPELGKEKLLDLVEEQLEYHKVTRRKKNYGIWHNLKIVQNVLLIAFILFAALDVYVSFMKIDKEHEKCLPPHWLVLFFNLVIPPIYAGIEGFIFFKEFRRNLNDSDIMISFFDTQKDLLTAIDPQLPGAKEKLTEMANKIRNKMDEENLNWAYTTNLKSAPGP